MLLCNVTNCTILPPEFGRNGRPERKNVIAGASSVGRTEGPRDEGGWYWHHTGETWKTRRREGRTAMEEMKMHYVVQGRHGRSVGRRPENCSRCRYSRTPKWRRAGAAGDRRRDLIFCWRRGPRVGGRWRLFPEEDPRVGSGVYHGRHRRGGPWWRPDEVPGGTQQQTPDEGRRGGRAYWGRAR